MHVVTHRERGLFPKPQEIAMKCSCPDWATMCKHVAAVMYGAGALFDERPDLLFTLRKVDHGELIAHATDIEVSRKPARRKTLDDGDLGQVFGIEIAEAPARPSRAKRPGRNTRTPGKPKVRRGRAGSRAS